MAIKVEALEVGIRLRNISNFFNEIDDGTECCFGSASHVEARSGSEWSMQGFARFGAANPENVYSRV